MISWDSWLAVGHAADLAIGSASFYRHWYRRLRWVQGLFDHGSPSCSALPNSSLGFQKDMFLFCRWGIPHSLFVLRPLDFLESLLEIAKRTQTTLCMSLYESIMTSDWLISDDFKIRFADDCFLPSMCFTCIILFYGRVCSYFSKFIYSVVEVCSIVWFKLTVFHLHGWLQSEMLIKWM